MHYRLGSIEDDMVKSGGRVVTGCQRLAKALTIFNILVNLFQMALRPRRLG